MSAKIRVKCAHCGDTNNVHSINDPCPKCRNNLGVQEDGNIYIYRKGSFVGVANGFSLYINNQPFGHIGNKELLRIPVKYGTYNIHVACGMNRKCQDLQVTISPETPVAYTRTYMKSGFCSNNFFVEYVDPNLLDL